MNEACFPSNDDRPNSRWWKGSFSLATRNYEARIQETTTPTWLTFLAPSIYLYLYLLITQAIARKYLLALSLSSAWRGGRCPISPERALSPLYPCPFVRFNPLRNDPVNACFRRMIAPQPMFPTATQPHVSHSPVA